MTADSSDDRGKLPTAPSDKPSLFEYLEECLNLPFKLPSLPTQTAKNLIRAAGRIIDAQSIAWEKGIKTRGDVAAKIIDARGKADIVLIKEGTNQIRKGIEQRDPALIERAKAAALGELVREQVNREDVVKIACEELEKNPPKMDAAGEIDDDWLTLFYSFASKKSRNEVQVLWGRILAGEIKSPGSVKLRTLQQISVLDATEAALIHEYMNCVIDGHMLFCPRHLVPKTALFDLHDAGVIADVDHAYAEYQTGPEKALAVSVGRNRALLFESDTEQPVHFHEVIPLTSFGRDLYGLANTPALRPEILDRLVKLYRPAYRRLLLVTFEMDGNTAIVVSQQLL